RPVRELLGREWPRRYVIIEQNIPRLWRQVMLDLPDIDSHWGDHVATTRRMLRHMLFPIWMQSIEKYADRQPQELLKRVAAGNAPGNFVFCLNKIDQLETRGETNFKPDAEAAGDAPGSAAAPMAQLKQDYAVRLQ